MWKKMFKNSKPFVNRTTFIEIIEISRVREHCRGDYRRGEERREEDPI